MVRNRGAQAKRLEFGEMPFDRVWGGPSSAGRRGLRLATLSGVVRGPDKYRVLDLKRRRAQIRARRVLGLVG